MVSDGSLLVLIAVCVEIVSPQNGGDISVTDVRKRN